MTLSCKVLFPDPDVRVSKAPRGRHRYSGYRLDRDPARLEMREALNQRVPDAQRNPFRFRHKPIPAPDTYIQWTYDEVIPPGDNDVADLHRPKMPQQTKDGDDWIQKLKEEIEEEKEVAERPAGQDIKKDFLELSSEGIRDDEIRAQDEETADDDARDDIGEDVSKEGDDDGMKMVDELDEVLSAIDGKNDAKPDVQDDEDYYYDEEGKVAAPDDKETDDDDREGSGEGKVQSDVGRRVESNGDGAEGSDGDNRSESNVVQRQDSYSNRRVQSDVVGRVGITADENSPALDMTAQTYEMLLCNGNMKAINHIIDTVKMSNRINVISTVSFHDVLINMLEDNPEAARRIILTDTQPHCPERVFNSMMTTRPESVHVMLYSSDIAKHSDDTRDLACLTKLYEFLARNTAYSAIPITVHLAISSPATFDGKFRQNSDLDVANKILKGTWLMKNGSKRWEESFAQMVNLVSQSYMSVYNLNIKIVRY